GDAPPHVDVADEMKESPKEKSEERDPDDSASQHPKMDAWAERLFSQGNQDILNEDAAPGVQMGGIAAKNSHEQNGAKNALNSRRQEIGQGDRGLHFFPKLLIGNL